MTTVYREERFRTPMEVERSLGIWVDRIGFDRNTSVKPTPDRYRVLGQFAAVGVVKGRGTLEVFGARPVAVREGDALLVFPSATEHYGPDWTWSTFWVVWNGPEAEAIRRIGYIAEDNPVVRGGATAVRAAWDRLQPLMSREDRDALIQRKIAILEMVLELDTLRRMDVAPAVLTAVELAVCELAKAKSGPMSLAGFARGAKVSPGYFRRIFKERTGVSPRGFYMVQRINRAKGMLSEGRPIKEVSEVLGFNDVFHFMRTFKKMTGQTAACYAGRRRH